MLSKEEVVRSGVELQAAKMELRDSQALVQSLQQQCSALESNSTSTEEQLSEDIRLLHEQVAMRQKCATRLARAVLRADPSSELFGGDVRCVAGWLACFSSLPVCVLSCADHRR